MEGKAQNQQQLVEELQSSLRRNIGQTSYEYLDDGGKPCMKVYMTDKQVDELRRQIAAYGVLSERLVSMYNAKSADHPFIDIRPERFNNTFMTSSGYRVSTRHRWTPTLVQLRILEKNFDVYKGSPRKERIHEIAAELSQYGQITGANVCNWFQNRKARTKKKQTTKSKTELEDKTDTHTFKGKASQGASSAPGILWEALENYEYSESLDTFDCLDDEINVMLTPHLPDLSLDPTPGTNHSKNQE